MKLEKSKDGTVKFDFDEGYSCVLIRIGGRNTLCLSSQVGCAMGCRFCLSGKRSFERNLSLDELKGQLDAALQHLGVDDRKLKIGKRVLADEISGIVFMGMGEPMLNLDNVLGFCAYVNAEYGYAYSRILVSTSGIIPGMRRVIDEYGNKVQLAVSLHSPFQEVRDEIMPGLKGFPLGELVEVMHEYNEVYRQKIMIEYLMIDGVTDRDEDLDALLKMGFAKRTLFNLIGLNACDGELKGSSGERVEEFRNKLMGAGYKCFTRKSMGGDIGAACGMLK
ncbi:23S rRNA (adenine(2503)-C(2))-methyltransferase RlmN [Methanococcoides sp. SA1]|nr:23S rRNA (adenine(2503)-C(2))-methyltransferase RlmN [Methanococcoides sp. SA1]